MIMIEDAELHRLIENRKSAIGQSASTICAEIISFIGLAVSAWQIESVVFQYLLWIAAACVAWRVSKMTTNRYSAERLEVEIKSGGGNIVWVQVPLPAPKKNSHGYDTNRGHGDFYF